MPAESELLPRKRCDEILLAAQTAAFRHGVEDVEVYFHASSESLTRFANNAIHQNVSERSVVASIRAVVGQRTARASTNRLTREGVQAAVDEAVALARASEPLPDLPEMLGPVEAARVERWDAATAHCAPVERARRVAEAVGIAQAAGLTAAGIFATEETVEAILNSRGLAQYHCETMATFSMTAMGADSSGWAKSSAAAAGHLNTAQLAERAVRKARLSARPKRIDPGAYTVILEPAAVLDLVGQMFPDFSLTAIEDQRSFLKDREWDKLFAPEITIYDDAGFPLQSGAPFDGEGLPRRALTLVRSGCVVELPCSRQMALKKGLEPTGHGFPLPNEQGEAPVNIVIAGGKTCLNEMIASTAHGILLTRVWYVRETDPYEKTLTGMTRDGTFLIRDGEIACGVRNLRFNESLIRMLRSVELLSPSVRASGEEAFDMVAPAMKVRDFPFTEVTEY